MRAGSHLPFRPFMLSLLLIAIMAGTTGPATLAQDSRLMEQVTNRLFNDVLTQRTAGACEQLMTSGAMNHTQAGDYEGPAGCEQLVADFRRVVPNATFVIDDTIVHGDLVMLRWTMRGQYLDAYREQAAFDVEVQIQGLAMLRFDNGMIVESWFEYDRTELLAQAPVSPIRSDPVPGMPGAVMPGSRWNLITMAA